MILFQRWNADLASCCSSFPIFVNGTWPSCAWLACLICLACRYALEGPPLCASLELAARTPVSCSTKRQSSKPYRSLQMPESSWVCKASSCVSKKRRYPSCGDYSMWSMNRWQLRSCSRLTTLTSCKSTSGSSRSKLLSNSTQLLCRRQKVGRAMQLSICRAEVEADTH